MSFATVSSKGQITLPSKMRSKLGISSKDKVQIILRDQEIVLRPLRSFRELRGTVSPKEGDTRQTAHEAAARHVMEGAD